MNDRFSKQTRGFTLVELLIVVVIIGILITGIVTVINPAQVRGRARDAQRIADLKTLQTALEQYYLKKRTYPAAGSFPSGSFVYVSPSSGVLYTNLVNTPETKVLDKIPTDPQVDASPLTSPCAVGSPTDYRYNYLAPPISASILTDAPKYVLTAIMETATANEGNECGRLTNWTTNFSNQICGGGGGPATCNSDTNGLPGASPNFPTCDFCYGVENR